LSANTCYAIIYFLFGIDGLVRGRNPAGKSPATLYPLGSDVGATGKTPRFVLVAWQTRHPIIHFTGKQPMKSLLLLGLTTLFFVEEPSYNFGGCFSSKGDVLLTISVQDGSYWVKFTDKRGGLSCELSEKASVKKGALRIQTKQGNQPITLIISPADHTQTMLVRGLRKADQYELMHFCQDSVSFADAYKRIP
jgi:hypothetical protein